MDLGNSNTVISVFDKEDKKVSPVELNELSFGDNNIIFEYPKHFIPTVVAVGYDGKLTFGNTALRQENANIYKDIKKDIIEGKYNKKEPFKILNEAPSLMKCFLHNIIDRLSKREGMPIKICISHPANSAIVDGTAYKQLLKSILEEFPESKIEDYSLCDEPYAASVGYHVYKKDSNHLIYIFDFGSCTINTLVLVSGRQNDDRIIASNTEFFGGRRIDIHLADYLNKKYLNNELQKGSNIQYLSLLDECEKAKISLSKNDKVILNFRNKEIQIDKNEFDFQVLKDNEIDNDIKEILNSTLDIATVSMGRKKEEIKYVIFTGGSSLIKSVKQQLQEYFSSEGHNILNDKIFTAVADGLSIVSSGRVTIKELRFDFFVGSFHPKSNSSNWVYQICSAREPFPSKQKRAFYIEPANWVMYEKPQEELELFFYFCSPFEEGSVQKTNNCTDFQYLHEQTFNHQYIGEPLIIYAPNIKKLKAEYWIDQKGSLLMSIINCDSGDYAKAKQLDQTFVEAKDLLVLQLD